MVGPSHPLTDQAVVEAIVEATPWIIAVLLIPLTHLGSVLIIVPALAVGYLWRPRVVAPWIGAVAAYYGLMAGIKSLNSATRPVIDTPVSAGTYPELFSWWYTHATSISTTSFPSGNAMVATLLAGLITLDLNVGTRKQRALVTGTLAALVAYSRVGIGVHYPVDVVGGVVLGVVLLGVIVMIRRRTADDIAAIFALGAVCAAFAIWVTTPVAELPSVDSIAGSNRQVAFGGAVGCLLGWHLKDRYAESFSDKTAALVTGICLLVSIAVYSGLGMPTNPVVTTGRTLVFCAAFILLPWVMPGRATVTRQVRQPQQAD